MANSKSAEKSARVSARKAVINRRVITALRTRVKDARQSIDSKDVSAAQKSTREAVAALDKAGTQGYIHPNKASRTVSRLMCHLGKLMTQTAKPAKPKATTRRRTVAKAKK